MIFINLDKLETVSKLTKICEHYKNYMDTDVVHGKYIVDGCSILGVVSLLGNVVRVVPNTNDDLLLAYFIRELQDIGAWVEKTN